MKFSAIAEVATKVARQSLTQTKKYSPELLIAVGVVGVVTAGVLAARATLKLEKTLDESNSDLAMTKSLVETGHLNNGDLTKVYIKNVGRVVKLYAGPVAIAGVSITCIVGSHIILRNRNTALVAAYNSLAAVFATYRNRVIDEFGEDKDKEYRYGVKEETVVDETTGKKRKVKTQVQAADEYIFEFGPDNENWTGHHDHNRWFLTGHQNVVNDRLRYNGHVFLNEVLDRLGFPRTPAGAVVGWLYKGDGDGFIDFGIDDPWNIRAGARENGNEGVIRLNMNVDGVIFKDI